MLKPGSQIKIYFECFLCLLKYEDLTHVHDQIKNEGISEFSSLFFETFKTLNNLNLEIGTSILDVLLKFSSTDTEIKDKILKTCFDL